MASLDPVHLSDKCSFGVVRQVLMQHWFGPVTLPDANATLTAHGQARRAGGMVSVLVVVEGMPGLPDATVRPALAKLTDATKHEVACHATVIRSEGFAGSALRSVLTAIFALSSAEYPKRVFADVKEAVDWLAGYTSGVSRTELVVAAEELMAFSHLHERSA